MDVIVTTLVLPASAGEDTPVGSAFRAAVDLTNRVRTLYYGTPAVALAYAEALALYRGNTNEKVVNLVAHDGGRLVGRATWWLPQLESLTMIEGNWAADPDLPDAGRRAVAEAFLDALESHADEVSRNWLLVEVPCEPGSLVPTSGVGGADPAGPDSAALLGRGFSLEQIYRYQLADLAALPDLDARLAAAASEGYQVVTWTGRVPPEHRAAFATLAGAMVAEIPSGGIEFEPQTWDDARLSEYESMQERAGRTLVGAIALASDGEPAGYTELFVPGGQIGRQGDTLVLPARRGRGLGRWLKLANLVQARDAFPALRFVTTDNAEENAWMLAINDELGFSTTLRQGYWQRRPR